MTQVIAGRYQIEAEIGAGGMGIVYQAIDLNTSQPVAIKALNTTRIDFEQVERFRREGAALRDLNHPNIVKLLDQLEDNGRHYLVMEYVTGGDLSSLLKQGPLSLATLLPLAIDLADALTRAHKLNIIHRDLKPGNVLLANDGTLRLSDFGIAYVAGQPHITRSNAIVGTVNYLAPEAIRAEPIDGRVDIWAFGVLLFELLTGQHPFDAASSGLIIMNILSGSPPDLEALRPDVPAALIDLVYRMLARDLHERIASVRIVGAELEAILQGRSTRFHTPTPTSSARPKDNLPLQMTPFVGREAELEALAHLMDEPSVRLVTLVAPGGMGKTRLSLAAAEQQLPRFSHGVYLVELARLTDANSLIPAIGTATGYQFQADTRDVRQQLLDYLREKHLLLVLDNFEQLIGGGSIVTDILETAPVVKVLVTSRLPLNLPGETLFHLAGMDLPVGVPPEAAMHYAAVRLFVNGARRARPDFDLSADNLPDVVRICHLVEGMPLGIVLAAAWVSLLPPHEIAAEIQRSLDFLEAPDAEPANRQRSLRAVFDYAWHMLTPEEQSVFMKLSVFRGGFTRPAGQAITGASLRALMGLVNKSLLRRDAISGRYTVHELLRQDAESRLNQSGDADTIYDAHSDCYLSQLHERHKDLEGPAAIDFLNAIRDDLENINQAALWAARQGLFELLDKAAYTLRVYFHARGNIFAGYTLFQQARLLLEQQVHTPERDAVLLHLLVHLITFQDSQFTGDSVQFTGDPVLNLFEESRRLIRDDSSPLVRGFLAMAEGNYQLYKYTARGARPYYEQALAWFRQAGDSVGQAQALNSLGNACWLNNAHAETDWQLARKYYTAALDIQRSRGDVIDMAYTWNHLGILAMDTHEPLETIRQFYLSAIEYAERIENRSIVAMATMNMGMAFRQHGWHQEGLRHYHQALTIQEELGNADAASVALANIAAASISLGDYPTAQQTVGRGLHLTAETNFSTKAGFLFQKALIEAAFGNYAEASHWFEKYTRAAPENPTRRSEGYFQMALVAVYQGDFAAAYQHAEQVKVLFDQFDNPAFLHTYHNLMAILTWYDGDYPVSEYYARTAASYFRSYVDREYELSVALIAAGMALSSQGRTDEARSPAFEALSIAGKATSPRHVSQALVGIAEWFLADGQVARSARIASMVQADRRVPHHYCQDAARTLQKCQGLLTETEYYAALDAGQSWQLETAAGQLIIEFREGHMD